MSSDTGFSLAPWVRVKKRAGFGSTIDIPLLEGAGLAELDFWASIRTLVGLGVLGICYLVTGFLMWSYTFSTHLLHIGAAPTLCSRLGRGIPQGP